MQIDPATRAHGDNYTLLTNLVVPRPIAWISTVSRTGLIDLAPFSFFNAVGSDPLYLAVSVGRRTSGEPKDTSTNILATQGFVVNLVTESLMMAMNISAADFPPDQSELPAVGLVTEPSARIMAPRIAAAHASLECKLFQSIELGANTLFIGEVVMFHVADHLIGPGVQVDDFAPIGRMGSPSMYCRTTDRFAVPRISYAQWLKDQ
jgi:flavin reductase (DIM6/NTAB) family NADH-FMN oxidoreductase RutF